METRLLLTGTFPRGEWSRGAREESGSQQTAGAKRRALQLGEPAQRSKASEGRRTRVEGPWESKGGLP